jgi:hypothetical protein
LRRLSPITAFTFWPHQDARGDELSSPPILWWTYQESPDELVEFLKQLVAAFEGAVTWKVWATGRRLILMPSRVREYAELYQCKGDLVAAAQLKLADPEFGKRANADLPLLTEHLCRHLAEAGESLSEKIRRGGSL